MHVVKVAYGILPKTAVKPSPSPSPSPSPMSESLPQDPPRKTAPSEDIIDANIPRQVKVNDNVEPSPRTERVIDPAPKPSVDFASEFHDEDEEARAPSLSRFCHLMILADIHSPSQIHLLLRIPSASHSQCLCRRRMRPKIS